MPDLSAQQMAVVTAAKRWLSATDTGDYHAQCDALRHLGSSVQYLMRLEASQ